MSEQPPPEPDEDEQQPDESDTTSAPTRGGSNVPNAARDTDENRNE